MRLASRAFRTVRISADAARTDPYLAPYARSAPAMIVLAPDLRRESATYGQSLDSRAALDALRASAKSDLGLDLDAAVTRARALVAEEQAVAVLKAALVRSAPEDKVRAAELDRRLAAIRAEQDLALRPPASRGR